MKAFSKNDFVSLVSVIVLFNLTLRKKNNGAHKRHSVNLTKIFSIVLLFTSVIFIIIPIQSVYAIAWTFSSSIQLSNDTKSVATQIAVNGSNIFSIWRDTSKGTSHINFTRSTDSGTTFSTTTDLSGNVAVGAAATAYVIAVSGSNVYVVWQNATSVNADIFLERSTDSGVTFNGGTAGSPGTPINLSNNVGVSNTPQVTVSGNNVYIVWSDTASAISDIYFIKSTDGGSTFSAPVNLSNTAAASITPQITVVNTKVYVTWLEGAPAVVDYAKSTDGGSTFSAPVNLSTSLSSSSSQEQIVASSTNVVVVWKQASNNHIFATNSTDSGSTFNGGTPSTPGTAVDLGAAAGATTASVPRLAMSGSNVYVVWQQITSTFGSKADVFYSKSTDSGVTFNGGTTHTPGTPIDLSFNTGDSLSPVISASGSNVYVVWQDRTVDVSPNGDIYFSGSNDSGSIFNGGTSGSPGAPVNISQSTGILSAGPAVGALAGSVYVAWQETGAATGNILFSRGLTSTTSIGFNAQQYKQSDSATVTAVSSASNTNPAAIETISATITSTADPTGISLTLTETGINTGIFTGQMTFTTGSSSGSTLNANPGNTITASFGGQTGTASIFPRTVAFNFGTYTMSSLALITVTDQNSVTNPSTVETIPITVSSTTTLSGIPLTLTETGPGTGIFKNTNLIFTTGNALFTISSNATLSQQETAGGQATNNVIDTISVTVTSTSDPVGITPVLTETGPNTGQFSGKLFFTSGASYGNAIKVTNGDIIGVTYLGETARGLVTPNTNAGVGALPTAIGDTITANYNGAIGTATIGPGSGGGGGGGGLLRPGLVLDILAAIAHGGSASVSPSFDLSREAAMPGILPDDIRNLVLNHDPLKPQAPLTGKSFDFPLSIDGGGYALGGYTNTIVTNTEQTGIPVDVKLNIPATGLQHIALYTNLRGNDRDLYHSDTYIIYDKGQPLQIVDPHGYFKDIKFDMSTSGIKNTIDYKITFAKPMEKSDIDMRAWNDHSSSSDIKILDAWQVIESPSASKTLSDQIPQTQSSQPNSPSDQPVKTEEQNTTPTDLISSIKEWGGYTSTSISDEDLLKAIGIPGHHIPPWFMKTTKWLVDGKITQDDFLNAIKYMQQTNMIK